VQGRVLDARNTRWNEHRATVRAELVDAAFRAIEHFGASVSMDEIAAEAGASKPKLYRYFSDKAGLYSAIAARVGSMIWHSAQSVLMVDADASVEQMMRSGINAYVALVNTHPRIFQFLMVHQMFQYSSFDDGGGAAEQLQRVMTVFADRFATSLKGVGASETLVPMALASILGSGLSSTKCWLEVGRPADVNTETFSSHLEETTWGIIYGAARASGVIVDRARSFDDPEFLVRAH
jgi:AcrR family transcriptional regulator